MRKRLVIGAIAAVVFGVAAYVLSQPREGDMEYHKTEILEDRRRFSPSWVERMPVPGFVRGWYYAHRLRRRAFHERALIDGGYLKEAFVPISSPLNGSQKDEVFSKLGNVANEDTLDLIILRRTYTNAVIVIAPTNTFDRVVAAIREADRARSK